MNRGLDIFKYQKYFLELAISLSLTSVSITDTEGRFKLVLRNYPVVILFLMAIAIFLALLYIAVDKRKLRHVQ